MKFTTGRLTSEHTCAAGVCVFASGDGEVEWMNAAGVCRHDQLALEILKAARGRFM